MKFRIRLDGCWDGGMESEGPGYLSIPDGSPKNSTVNEGLGWDLRSAHCYWEGHNQHIGYQGTFER